MLRCAQAVRNNLSGTLLVTIEILVKIGGRGGIQWRAESAQPTSKICRRLVLINAECEDLCAPANICSPEPPQTSAQLLYILGHFFLQTF